MSFRRHLRHLSFDTRALWKPKRTKQQRRWSRHKMATVAVIICVFWYSFAWKSIAFDRKASFGDHLACRADSRNEDDGNEVTLFAMPSSYRYEEFLEGPGLAVLSLQHDNNTTVLPETACKFQFDNHTYHFPHAMQHLLRCFSWWRSRPDQQAWLLGMPITQESEFMAGMMRALRDVFHVNVVKYRLHLQVVRPIVEYGYPPVDEVFSLASTNNSGFQVQSPSHVHELRDGILQHYFQELSVCGGDATTLSPRITILNRQMTSGRHLHIQTIQERLAEALELSHAKIQVVEPFDDTTFLNQVQIMAATDILISPHGAQLTGLMFLPPCAQVVEVFGSGYAVPSFFGSLAAASDVDYSYYYAGTKADLSYMETLQGRSEARNWTVCPNVEALVTGVVQRVHAWHTCCLHQRAP